MSEKYLGEYSTPLLINQIKSKCTQKATALPIASFSEFGKIYQYIGATSGDLVHNYFYECVTDGQDPAHYSWEQVNVQPTAPSPTAATTSFDNTTSELTATNVQDAIDEIDGAVDTLETTKQDVMQATTLPTASATEFGKVYQYLGADNVASGLKHGYFYECVYDGITLEYFWEQTNVQPYVNPSAANIEYDNSTSGLTADDVQEAIDEVDDKVDTINNNIVGINEKIPSTASDTNQLVDHDSLGTAAFKDFTANVAPNNHGLVESNAVYSAINNALSSVYSPRGDLTCAELTSSLLIAANVGNVYEMSDSGTTSALFLQGAGVPINVGDNVGIIQAGVDTYKFNLMANAFDLTDYQKQNLTSPITVDGTQKTTVESALSGLNTAVSGRLQEIGALPTASVDNLHKTYLLIGTQTGYDKGAIYQCQSDGQDPATYSWVKISSADVPIATTSVAGIVKPDGDTINVDANGTTSVGENYKTMFVGTTQQWTNLTTEQKAKFDTYCLTDDIASGQMIVSGTVTEGDHNPVSSDGVYNALPKKYRPNTSYGVLSALKTALGHSDYPFDARFTCTNASNTVICTGIMRVTSDTSATYLYASQTSGYTMSQNQYGSFCIYDGSSAVPSNVLCEPF